MNKSTITRERLEEIILDNSASLEEFMAITRMALAAMDSEPVAWTWHHLKQWHVTNDEERVRDLAWDGVKLEPLYRHAQPAPVVPDERDKTVDADDHPLTWSFNEGWNACRSAMLQAEPVTTANKLGNSPVIPDGSASMLRRWLAFGRGMQNAGCQLPHNLIAETEAMLAAAPQEVKGE